EVLRFDVPVLDTEAIEVVDPLGSLPHELREFVGGDACPAGLAQIIQAVQQGLVTQFHSDDEVASLLPDAEHRHQMRAPDVTHVLQCALLGRASSVAQGDELERDLEVTRAPGFPNLTTAAPAESFDEEVTGYRF